MRKEPIAPTLSAAIEAAATLYPDFGHTYQDGAGNEKFYNFKEVQAAAETRGAALQKLGLRKGDRVGMIVIEPEDFVLTFLGALRVGIVPVPLYPPLSMGELDNYMDRLTRILSTAQADVLVASGSLKNLLWGLVDRVPTLRKLVEVESLHSCDRAADVPLIEPNDICFLQYTSGSTSDPKGVIVTHANLAANAKGIMSHLGLDSGDIALSWLPLYHDMGLIGFVVSTLFWGMSSVFIPTMRFLKRPNVWMDACSKHKAHITFCPPFALGLAARRATPAKMAEWDLSNLRHIGVGAEPINPTSARQFMELMIENCSLPKTAILPAYGMAEATLAISLKPINTEFKVRSVNSEIFQGEAIAVDTDFSEFSLEHVSCGTPFPEHEVAVFNPETGLRVDDDDVEGELCLRGPSVTPGYYLNPEATAACFREGGWLHTGDLGYLRDGEVYVTGRLKDLIILNGRNVHPQSIEWDVHELEHVRKGNVVAFSVPGKDTEKLIIALETKDVEARDFHADVRARVSDSFGMPVEEVIVLSPGQ